MTVSYVEPSYVNLASRRLNALSPLGRDEEALLRQAAVSTRTFSARSDILREGQPVPQPHIILEGWAYRSRILSDGRRQIQQFLLPGDLIGMCRHADPVALTTISAQTSVMLCAAPQPLADREFGLAEAYARSNSLEEGYLLRHITRLGRMSAYERIVDWMMEISERLVRAGAGSGDSFAFPVTQELMADLLGLTNVHVNRMLQALLRDGLLKVHGGWVSILDRPACERLSESTWGVQSGHRRGAAARFL
jgi:CRP-like cAMP-binding protein